MKKKLVSGLILLILLFAALPYSAGAAEENLLNTSSGNVLGGGENLQINQNISRDLVIAGSRLEINGNTGNDVIVAGGELIVNGNVTGNIIAAGGSITVNGNVGGDVVAAGGQISLSRNSVVKGDVLLGGGEITLDGTVNGNGNISAGTLKTGDGFKLKGNLGLQADNYPSNLKDKVGGNLNIKQTNATANRSGKPFEGVNIFSFILEVISAVALGFILIYLFPGFVGELEGLIKDSPLKAGLLGFLTLVFLPILAIILLITIFGWSLSFLIILFLALALLIATVPVKLLAGEMIYRKILRRDAGKMMYYLVGAVIFGIVFEIPFVGGLIRFIAILIGLGAIVVWLENRARPAS
jgi:cytoskeletal protein CcmA (bactofilin family)